MSQCNERKVTPREIKKPHASNLTKPLAAVPPPTIYVLSKNSPCSLNIQVELTSLTSLASVSTSALLDSRATGVGRIIVHYETCPPSPGQSILMS